MKHRTLPNLLITLILALALLPANYTAYAAGVTVNSTTDVSDGDTSSIANLIASPGADGVISLREAMEAANSTAGADTITFNIPGGGVHTITPASPLPNLNDSSGGATIDGYSQPGAIAATDTTSATLKIVIDGSGAGNTNGFNISQPGNVIKGLVINSFAWNGISINGLYGTDNVISGNYIGTDANGTDNQGNGWSGISLRAGAQNNTIGGDTPGDRNIISGNGTEGINLHDTSIMNNTIVGNYIGLDANGATGLGNSYDGILIFNGPQNNTIGGDTSAERNVISGNGANGISIYGSSTISNTISGNYIGTDAGGTADLGNGTNGVYIYEAPNNTIGGATTGERNIISGNDGSGVVIQSGSATANTISGNYIGLDAGGTVDLGNTQNGIQIYDGAHTNIIGGDTPGERNVISGNGGDGVYIQSSGAVSNSVAGNYIGTDAGGTVDLGNDQYGVEIYDGPQNNTIGGTTPGERNVISGNDRGGITLRGSGTMSNTVSGNIIGLDSGGTTALGNAWDGVEIRQGAQNNTIGPGNIIAYSNLLDGVDVDGSNTTGNIITRNSIFSNFYGIDLANGANGGIAPPVIVTATLGSVNIIGTACPGCTVEIFENSTNDGEGETYVGNTVATGSGAFTVTVSTLSKPFLTATATDAISGTSEFSDPPFASPESPVYLPLILRDS